MLRRIESSVTDNPEPLSEPDRREMIDLQKAYEELSILRRFLIWLKTVFTGLNREQAVEEILLKDLARHVHQHDPRLLDYHRGQLRTGVFEQLKELREHARVLNPLLTRIHGKEKQPFVVFFAEMEIEEQHNQLLADTDPKQEYTIDADVAERDIRSKLNAKMEATLQTIPKIHRQRVTISMKFLELLFRLSSYPFDRLINRFQELEDGTAVCGFDQAADDLEELAAIMAGLTEYPGMRVLQAAILFAYQAENGGVEQSEEQMKTHLQKVLAAAEGIRYFNRLVPLSDLVRLVRRQRSYQVRPEGGGEEWYQLYLRYWKHRLDRLLSRFVARRRLQHLVREAAELIETPRIEAPSFYPRRETGEPGLYGLSLAFIRHFHTQLYPKRMEGPIRTVFVDGEFYKQANREQFNSVVQELQRLRERVELLERNLQPGGEIREKVKALGESEQNPRARRKGIVEQIRGIENEARGIVEETLNILGILENLLNGILNARAGSAYDTLANRSQIGGSRNSHLLEELSRCIEISQEVRRVAGELLSIEKSSQDTEEA